MSGCNGEELRLSPRSPGFAPAAECSTARDGLRGTGKGSLEGGRGHRAGRRQPLGWHEGVRHFRQAATPSAACWPAMQVATHPLPLPTNSPKEAKSAAEAAAVARAAVHDVTHGETGDEPLGGCAHAVCGVSMVSGADFKVVSRGLGVVQKKRAGRDACSPTPASLLRGGSAARGPPAR